MKKVIRLSVSEWIMAIGLLAALGVLMAPVYRLALYSVPYYDDFWYGQHVRNRIADGNTLINTLKGCWDCIVQQWTQEQGTYSSAFMMALVPVAWDSKKYFIGVWAIITALLVGTFSLGWSISKYVFKSNVPQRIIFGAGLSIFLSQLIYSAQQGIYWYDGAVHYTFMHGVLFVMIALLIKLIYADKKKSIISTAIFVYLLSFICAGANFISTLQGAVFIVCIMFLCIIWKKTTWKRLIPAIALYLVGMGLNIFAPGNSYREAYYADVHMGALEAIGNSFVAAFQYLWEMTDFITIVVIICFIPIAWNMVSNIKFEFKYPGLITLLSFCVYATGYTPGFYAMGYAGLARMFCAVKYTLEILIVLNELYWCGWIRKKISLKRPAIEHLNHNVWFYCACLFAMVICFVTSDNQAGHFLAYGSYYYVHTGEAENFYNEYYAWIDEIENGGSEIALDPLNWKPWFLCQKKQLSEDPNAEQNKAMEFWYGKDKIYIKSE